MPDFVHLHLHSEYSLLDGACRISELPEYAKSLGQKAVAITDHGAMYGAVDFYRACRKADIKPIIGCEVYVAKGSRFEKSYQTGVGNHLVLLVKNEVGYRNLIKLVSLGFTEGFYSKPRVDLELLREHSEGLVALSACLAGAIPEAIVSGNYQKAAATALELQAIFGNGNFYLELQDHGIRDQKTVNRALLRLSREYGIPLVATNDVHYLRKADAEIQAIMMCIQTGSVITDGRPIGFETDEFYFKSTDEMLALFYEYEGAVENTAKIADMCNFDFEFGHLELPRYRPDGGTPPDEYLRRLAYSGLDGKIAEGRIKRERREEYAERIDYEIGVIVKMGYQEYYLIVWDFVHYSRSRGIPVGPGRGSGAGSLVAFLIGITDVDSIKFGLLFERFLNPERVSMPDFDIDFCYTRRDEAIEYVRSKYGSDRTSQIITFGTLAARAAVRDVGRAMGLPASEIDPIAKLIPPDPKITLADALSGKKLKTLYDSDGTARRVLDLARRLEGMPRHTSIHAAGIVITERALTEYLPLAKSGDAVVTQYTMETVADLGLLKFDFLALRYLTVIDATERLIKRSRPDFTYGDGFDDRRTYELISSGKTDGVFQLESGGMRQMLMQLRPERIGDVIAAIALYRPGPMDSIPKYTERRHGGIPEYEIPELRDILDETYGCIVYQEQVMQIFRRIAGYSLGRADVVRRAISKKKLDVLNSEREAFLEGADRSGVDRSAAERLFEEIVGFANYAFNKSHAAAYAVLSYKTAYLKAHYPIEYMSALMTSVMGNPSKIASYMTECRAAGVNVLPPDINRSDSEFAPDGHAIRFALAALRNISRSFVDKLVADRERNGNFKDFEDFVSRAAMLDVNRRQLEPLIKSGALDSLGIYRTQMLASYEELLAAGENDLKNAMLGQLDLFSSSGTEAMKKPPHRYPSIPDYTPREKLFLEREVTGVYLSGNILDGYSRHLSSLKTDSINAIKVSFASEDGDGIGFSDISTSAKYREDSVVFVAGAITVRTDRVTKRGERMTELVIHSADGDISVLVFPKVFAAFGELLAPDSVIGARCAISVREDEEVKLIMRDAISVEDNESYRGEAEARSSANAEDKKTLAENAQKSAARPHSGEAISQKPSNGTAPRSIPAQARPTSEAQPSDSLQKRSSPCRVYLRIDRMGGELFERCEALIDIFSGTDQVIYYSEESKKYYVRDGGVCASDFMIREFRSLLGDGAVAVK